MAAENIRAMEHQEKNLKMEDVNATLEGKRAPLARAPATPQTRFVRPAEKAPSSCNPERSLGPPPFPILLSRNTSPGEEKEATSYAREEQDRSLRRVRVYVRHFAAKKTGQKEASEIGAAPDCKKDKNDDGQLRRVPCPSGGSTERLAKWFLPGISDEEAAEERRKAAEAQAGATRRLAENEVDATWASLKLVEPKPLEEAIEVQENRAKKQLNFVNEAEKTKEAVAPEGSKLLNFFRLISFPGGSAETEDCVLAAPSSATTPKTQEEDGSSLFASWVGWGPV